MRPRHRVRKRRGTELLQFAVIAPAVILLLFGLVVGALGVFRYQQIARLARDASRWASVHGTSYASFTGIPPATATDVYNNVIAPNAAVLNLSELTYSVTWSTSNAPYHTATVNGKTVNVANTVTVTINYEWIPEVIFGGATLTSTSVSVMSF